MVGVLAIILLLLISAAPASAQRVSLVFGPLEGDGVGILHTYEEATVYVDLWIRTDPNTYVTGLHLPLASKDDYIDPYSRNGGELYFPEDWFSWFTYPTPNPPDYTNQSIMAGADFPDPSNSINTEDLWLKIASYRMTSTAPNQFDTPFCDALIEGTDPINGRIVVTLFPAEELDPSELELHFACLEFERIWCDYVRGDYNGNDIFNVADIIASFSYLQTGSPDPFLLCECPHGSGNSWPVAVDFNNSCGFNVADVIAGFSYLQTGAPAPISCQDCPPRP